MNEKNPLERLLGEPPTPKADVTARARAQLNKAIRTTQPGFRPRLRRPVFGLAGLAAAATAAAIVVPSLATNGSDPGLPRSPDSEAQSPETLSAKEILLVAADRAEQQDETPSGDYWRVRSYGRGVLEWLKVGEKGDKYNITNPTVEEAWIARGAKGGTWTGERTTGYEPATKDDWEAWKRDGSPRKWNLGPSDTVDQHDHIVTMEPDRPRIDRWGKGNQFMPYENKHLTYGELRQLPTDPKTLTEYLLELQKETDGTSEPDEWVFHIASDLLSSAPAPADVRAAAFRAIAELPSVHNNGPAEDPLGREGVALSIDNSAGDSVYGHTELIIDERTGQLLATSMTGPKSGTSTTLAAEWTNEQPHVPSASDIPDIPIPD